MKGKDLRKRQLAWPALLKGTATACHAQLINKRAGSWGVAEQLLLLQVYICSILFCITCFLEVMESAHSFSCLVFQERAGKALKKLILMFVTQSGLYCNVEEQRYVNVMCPFSQFHLGSFIS